MSIYISIASYEDPFLERTIKSAIDNAKKPWNIYFGISTFYDKVEKPDLSFIKDGHAIILDSHPHNRPGLEKTRSVLRTLMGNQKYFLQIDSHSLFSKDWDINLVKELEYLESLAKNKVIISKYINESLVHQREDSSYIWRIDESLEKIDDNILTTLWTKADIAGWDESKRIEHFYKTTMMAGCFIFCKSDFIKDIRGNNIGNFAHEEKMDSFNAYLMGYDIYTFKDKNYVSHNNREYNKIVYGESKSPIKDFTSNQNRDSAELQKEMERNFIFNDSKYFKVINAERTPEEFWKEIGLHDFYLKEKKKFSQLD
jgi:hypothetical protein